MPKFIFAIMICAIFICGCSSNKSSTPNPDDNTYELIGTYSIGSDGGTVDDSTIVINIPANSLDQTTTVKLYSSDDDSLFSANDVSDTYKIEGLTSDFDDTLHVALKYDGVLNEESFIALGKPLFIPETSDTQVVYTLVEAEDSAGFLIADIPIEAGDVQTSGQSLGSYTGAAIFFYLLGATDMKTYSSDQFKIRYPRIMHKRVMILHEMLINSLRNMELFHFYPQQVEETMPISVLVHDKETGYLASYTPRSNYSHFTHRSETSITVREQELGPSYYDALKLDVGYNIYLLIAAMYNRSSVERQPLCWFDYACARWCQQWYSTEQNYVPAGAFTCCTAILDTFAIETLHKNSDHYEHGKAMASLIRFLTLKYGIEVIPRMRDTRHENGLSVRQALFGSYLTGTITDPYTDWWPEFIKQLINEELYTMNGVFSARLLDKIYHEYTIADESSQSGYIPAQYKDLQSKVFKFELTDPNIAAGDQLKLVAVSEDLSNEYMHVIVFKRKNDDIQYIDDGISIVIPDIYDIKQAGYDIYAVVVNCRSDLVYYYEKSDINLGFEIIPAPTINFVRAVITVVIDARLIDNYSDILTHDNYYMAWQAEGSTTGNTFEGDIDQYVQLHEATGTMTITFDPETFTILSADASATVNDESYGTENWSVSATGIPLTNMSDYTTCSIEGESTCDAVTGITQRWERDNSWTEILDYGCSSGSWIYITLIPE